MEIGNRTYKDKSSECWIILPSFTLSVNVWTQLDNTYLITEPIALLDTVELLESGFESAFTIKSIEDIDSTLLEKNKAIEIFNQKVNFNSNYLFKISNVQIEGKTEDGDIVKVKIASNFHGFEIWKMDDFQSYVFTIEKVLSEKSISFTTTDEIENGIIRITFNR